MCGVIGVFGPQHSDLKADVQKAMESLEHRGPDDSGLVHLVEDRALLGHTRLSILDLSQAGHQPMSDEQDWIVFNGEIYNHLELRRNFLSKKTFNSGSDTETLLALLKQHGISILSALKGMFAAAWYSQKTKQLILFRDSLGIKPLYYRNFPDTTVCFSSEVKALLKINSNRLETHLNLDKANLYLTYENFDQKSSLINDIACLGPGEVHIYSTQEDGTLKLKLSKIEPSISPAKVPDQEKELVDLIEKSIQDSVKMHLISDVPVGVYLSGGIDSSLVATMAAKEVSGIHGFTGYYETEDGFYDERNLARIVAKAAEIELHEIKITSDDFINNFDKIVYHLDQPRMGMGSFSQFIVAKEAAKHRKVILAGHGGDELFAGYPLHKAVWILTQGFNWKGLSAVTNLRAKEIPWLVYSLAHKLINDKLQFAPKIWNDRPANARSEAFVKYKSQDHLSELDEYYKNIYIPGLLDVEDRISMAHSLETRVPLWTQDMVHLASNISIQTKLTNGNAKYLLKLVAKKWLPSELLTAPKRGFPTPLRLWFRKELYQFASDRLLKSAHEDFYKVLDKDSLKDLLKSHKSSPRPFALDEIRAHKIWTAMCMESWMRQFDIKVNV